MGVERMHDLCLAHLHGRGELSQSPGVHDLDGLEDGVLADRLSSDLPVESAATDEVDVLVNDT
eukprot:6727648-Lingulodinium_polyedra.AAC.1